MLCICFPNCVQIWKGRDQKLVILHFALVDQELLEPSDDEDDDSNDDDDDDEEEEQSVVEEEEDEEDDDIFSAEKIMQKRETEDGQVQYKIKWLGYSHR